MGGMVPPASLKIPLFYHFKPFCSYFYRFGPARFAIFRHSCVSACARVCVYVCVCVCHSQNIISWFQCLTDWEYEGVLVYLPS